MTQQGTITIGGVSAPDTPKGRAWLASQPIIRNQIDKLKALDEVTREAMLEAYATGESVRKILARFGVGNRAFYKWLDEEPVMKQAWLEMRAYRARSFADDAQETVDAGNTTVINADGSETILPITTEEIQLRRLRAEIKLRLAAVTNPQEFGKSPKTVLQIEHLHLTALERVNREDTARRMQVLETTGAARPDRALPPPAEDPVLVDALAGL